MTKIFAFAFACCEYVIFVPDFLEMIMGNSTLNRRAIEVLFYNYSRIEMTYPFLSRFVAHEALFVRVDLETFFIDRSVKVILIIYPGLPTVQLPPG